MNVNQRDNLINVLIAVLIGGGIFFGIVAVFLLSPTTAPNPTLAPQTNTITKPSATPTTISTLTPSPNSEEDSDDQQGIKIGEVVQIYNTEGAGLRLRENPGISTNVQFIGEELELFTVVNGPTTQDGYTWWYLESPYDENRSGWAASDYLQIIEETE